PACRRVRPPARSGSPSWLSFLSVARQSSASVHVRDPRSPASRRLGSPLMNRHLSSLAIALAAAATAAGATAADSSEQVKPAFGNTVLSIYPDGRSQKIWMHPDGSWDGQSRRGTPLAGRWSVKDGKVCMKQS